MQQHDNPWSQTRAERGFWADGLGLTKISERHAPTLLFAGCSADQAIGRTGVVALAKLMQRAGEDFVILGDQEKCCGLHAYDLGFRREYERLQQENLDTIMKAEVRKLVIACGSCRRIWREQHAKHGSAGLEVLHGVEYLEGALRAGKLKITKPIRKKVTYHDSCHLGRGCGMYEAPRTVFARHTPSRGRGVKWNQRWAWCCGGGGGVPEADLNLAQWSATDRMREAKETGAEFSFDFKRVMPALVQCA